MARIKRPAPTVRSTPPRAAKKSSTDSSSGRKKLHSEEDDEEGSIINSEEEHSKYSGEESDGSEEEEATEAEDTADDSKSEAEDEAQEEASEAEESESNSEEDLQQEACARAADNTSKEYDESSRIDRYAEIDEEDKNNIRSLHFSDSQVLEFEKMLQLPQNDYGRFMKVLAIPKLMKHLTPQQTLGAIQYISNQLDPKSNRAPAVDEIRSFLYLQELVLLFAKKERKGKTTKCTY